MTTLALTGSTGALGGLVAPALADLNPRLLVRDPARTPRLGLDVRQMSYDDEAACLDALDGVDVLFMVSAAESADRRRDHRRFVDAAARAGVGHVVYTSFAAASPDAAFTLGRDHHDTETAVRESGLGFTLLRDNFYADVLPLFADEAGVIRGPAGDGRVAAVARADVADAAVRVLRDLVDNPDSHPHTGAVYTLTGPEALTMREVAGAAGESVGRVLRFEDQTEEEAYASRRAAWPDAAQWQLDAWVSTYTAIRDGACETVTDDVERLTGHPARTLADALLCR